MQTEQMICCSFTLLESLSDAACMDGPMVEVWNHCYPSEPSANDGDNVPYATRKLNILMIINFPNY